VHHLRVAIAASLVLLAAGIAGRAGAAGVMPPSLGSESLPYAYGAPHGYRPQRAYGPTSPYALAPYTYSLQRRHSTHSPQHAFWATKYAPAPVGYGPPSYGNGLLPSYSSNPEYGVPLRTYDPAPNVMPRDPSARLRAWNEIADSFTEALQQIRSAPSHGHSAFASRSATRPR
jgi:hypothetical protein